MFSLPPPWLCRVFLHDVTAAILVSQNNETAAMLVSQTNPPHLHKCCPREWKRSISHLLVNQSELEVAVTTSCLKKHVKTRKIVRSVLGQNSSTISSAMRRWRSWTRFKSNCSKSGTTILSSEQKHKAFNHNLSGCHHCPSDQHDVALGDETTFG